MKKTTSYDDHGGSAYEDSTDSGSSTMAQFDPVYGTEMINFKK